MAKRKPVSKPDLKPISMRIYECSPKCKEDYDVFEQDPGSDDMVGNRDVHLEDRQKLRESMERQGWLRNYPGIFREEGGRWFRWDGGHRWAIAKKLGIPMYWTKLDPEAHRRYDIAAFDDMAKGWSLKDYATTFKREGRAAYAEGLEFADAYGLGTSLGAAFMLLAGRGFNSFAEQGLPKFKNGTFKVTHLEEAKRVMEMYNRLLGLAPGPGEEKKLNIAKTRVIQVWAEVCLLPEFDSERFFRGVEEYRKLYEAKGFAPCTTHPQCRDMFTDIYNAKRRRGEKPAALGLLAKDAVAPRLAAVKKQEKSTEPKKPGGPSKPRKRRRATK